jgi:prophage regulatory protein
VALRATFRETRLCISAILLACMQPSDSDIYHLPDTGFVRLPQVLRVIPLGKTSWWEGVRSGRFPKPVKLSARCTAWRAEDIRDLIQRLSRESLTP